MSDSKFMNVAGIDKLIPVFGGDFLFTDIQLKKLENYISGIRYRYNWKNVRNEAFESKLNQINKDIDVLQRKQKSNDKRITAIGNKLRIWKYSRKTCVDRHSKRNLLIGRKICLS